MPLVRIIALSALLLCGMSASAQNAPPSPQELAEDALKTRKSVFTLLKFHFVPIYLMATGNAPFDAAAVEKNASRLAQLGPMIPDVLAKDTREFELDTEAKPEIWENLDEIAKLSDNLVAAATKMAEAAATGDQGATLSTFRPLGGTCGACHDDYRDKKD